MVDATIESAAVAIVGLCALNLAGKALLHLYKTFLRPGKNLKKLGKWAVVTGATGELLREVAYLLDWKEGMCVLVDSLILDA